MERRVSRRIARHRLEQRLGAESASLLEESASLAGNLGVANPERSLQVCNVEIADTAKSAYWILHGFFASRLRSLRKKTRGVISKTPSRVGFQVELSK